MPEKINKSKLIREAFAANPEATPQEIADSLGDGFTAAYVQTIISKEKNKGTKAKSSLASKDVDDVLMAMEICEQAKEQEVTIEKFVDSLKISWAVLDDISTVKELKDLKARKPYGKFVEKHGKTEAIRILRLVQKKV